ncbi:uncharacterized protein LOC6561248 [Drosophila grimshawi]|uniref:GH22034 n=1 Tax=Drosophila grimshawi TaxID=7222 RepID=B4J9K8_DROGR|nr:uncharacterized protein LOC6561248 [Drosophila grimshawi]EDW02515.1 GH22034 [Drosophila grimshawi]
MFFTISYLVVFTLILCDGYTRHTNLKCEVLEKSVIKIPMCKLKVMGRGRIAANVELDILQLPVESIQVKYSVFKKQNVYLPFLFNVSLDFCHFMKHPNRLNVFYYFHRALMPYTNWNHTCPYNHKIIIKDFVLTDEMFAKVPIPEGSYMFDVKVASNYTWVANFHAYFDANLKQNFAKRTN